MTTICKCVNCGVSINIVSGEGEYAKCPNYCKFCDTAEKREKMRKDNEDIQHGSHIEKSEE